MLLRVLRLIAWLCLRRPAQGQADTVRPRPAPGAAARTPAADSSRARDIEAVRVLQLGPSGGMDAVARQRLIDTLNAQRRNWERHRPRAYVIRVLEMSSCI